ncbi:hypothetical protein AAVH_18260 [Aphelenchoides avenae]|nr:hypothetical protein AAVH_18260 [Aphelenchus avenae]
MKTGFLAIVLVYLTAHFLAEADGADGVQCVHKCLGWEEGTDTSVARSVFRVEDPRCHCGMIFQPDLSGNYPPYPPYTPYEGSNYQPYQHNNYQPYQRNNYQPYQSYKRGSYRAYQRRGYQRYQHRN